MIIIGLYRLSLRVCRKLVWLTLLIQDLKRWDVDILNRYFASVEVDLILKIPLCPNYVEDNLFWPYVTIGVYSVKSKYNFLAKEKSMLSLNSSPQIDSRGIWKEPWSLSVPNKVKNFMWRTCKEAIPVKRNLVKKRILTEDICCHCIQAAEDVVHALWDCAKLSAIWESDMLWLFRRTKKII